MVKNKVMDIIIQNLRNVLDDKGININYETALFGYNGILDSMSLVSLIVAVEQDVEDEFGKEITIADSKAMSQKNSPFKTVGSLVEYIEKLLNEEE